MVHEFGGIVKNSISGSGSADIDSMETGQWQREQSALTNIIKDSNKKKKPWEGQRAQRPKCNDDKDEV